MTTFPIPPNYADHILVASPSTRVRQRVLESLRSPARRFEQASGGAEALAHLESGGWQVLFLDRRLPDLDAEELSQTVRQRFPEIEVVLLDPEVDSKFDSKLNPNPNPKMDADPSPNHVAAAALGRPTEQTVVPVKPSVGLTEWRNPAMDNDGDDVVSAAPSHLAAP